MSEAKSLGIRKPLSGTYETSTFREMIFFESQVRELEAYTSKLEKELDEMTSSCLENLAQKLQYRNIIEDLKSISEDHVGLSEKDQQIEDMKKDIQKFIEDYSGDDLTGVLVYWLNHWQMKDGE